MNIGKTKKHRNDETTEFRRSMERRARRHKTMPKYLFMLGCAVAGVVMAAAVLVVLLDK